MGSIGTSAVIMSVLLLLDVIRENGVLSECCVIEHDCVLIRSNLRCSRCADKTLGTPCCGYLGCNIFCCNCGGGCRKAEGIESILSSSSDSTKPLEIHDKDGDGFLNVQEINQMLSNRSCGNFTGNLEDAKMLLVRFDRNGDGKLSYEEIDEH